MTNTNVTYLFGAGASCQVLPLVADIPARLAEFLRDLKANPSINLPQNLIYDRIGVKESASHLQVEFYDAIEWLKKGTESHSSIDTFAKKLYATRRTNDLIKLKAVLTLFFIYKQIDKPTDTRYDSFFASLVTSRNGDNHLPNNLKILSWNYDIQFEKAFSEYTQVSDLNHNQSKLNVYPFSQTQRTDLFSIFKLNGTTAIEHPQERNKARNIFSDLNSKFDRDFMSLLIQTYAGLTKQSMVFKPMIKFAWEDLESTNTLITNAIESVKATEVLVVIGYSFPFFNREIDRRIIQRMPSLKKVYFQAPDQEADNYVDRFRSIVPDVERLKPEPIRDTKQFFLPHEL